MYVPIVYGFLPEKKNVFDNICIQFCFVKIHKFSVSVTLDRCLLSTEHVFTDSQNSVNSSGA